MGHLKSGEARPFLLRLYLSPEFHLGPGKADVLQAIAASGSISAAGRALGMSYRRTWQLVTAMNTHFREPLVITAAGGSSDFSGEPLRRRRSRASGSASP